MHGTKQKTPLKWIYFGRQFSPKINPSLDVFCFITCQKTLDWITGFPQEKNRKKKRSTGATPNESRFLFEYILCQSIITGVCYWFCVCVCVCVCTFFHLSGQTHNLENITKLVRTLWFLFWRYEIKTDFLLIVHFFPSFWSNTQPRQRNKISQNPLISLLVVWD